MAPWTLALLAGLSVWSTAAMPFGGPQEGSVPSAPHGRATSGTQQMQIFACNASSPNQVFDYTPDHTFRGRFSGLCITALGGVSAASALWPTPCVDSDASQAFALDANGHVRLLNSTPCEYQPCGGGACCECFDVYGGGSASGTELGTWPCAMPVAPNEVFSYDGGTGLLHATASGLCADAGSLPPLPLLASYFSDHMVLQRGAPCTVWGFAEPGTDVVVSFGSQQQGGRATAGGDRVWRFVLAAMPANASPANLTAATADGGMSVTVSDVLVGDVYIASGQSNMEFTVATAFNASAEIAASAAYPAIRIMTVGQGTQSDTPLQNLQTISQPWTRASPASVGLGAWSAFSAVGWFFARDVFNGLNRTVPLGVISDNWGGTSIQVWSSPAALAACNWTGGGSSLYNAMIAPLTTGPLALTGFLWYQGEANADTNTTAYYACAIQALVNSWRQEFSAPDAWFGNVQLAAYVQVPQRPLDSWHAAFFTRALPPHASGRSHTALATAIDLGDPPGSVPPPPYGTVHPRSKQPVGARLAANALAQVYGLPRPHLSPRYASAVGAVAGTAVNVTVTFDPATTADGPLQLNASASCPITLGVPADECGWAAILLADGTSLNASIALTSGGTGVVLSATAPTPGAVPASSSYAYNAWPVTTLLSAAGFPVLPWSAPLDAVEPPVRLGGTGSD